jgi:serine/threonine protein kinase
VFFLIYTDASHILGSGFFGKVLNGRLREVEVAVKTIKSNAERDVINTFLQEIKIMSYLGSHPNIVKFLGANTQGWVEGKIS